MRPFPKQRRSENDHAQNEVYRGADRRHYQDLDELRGRQQEDHVEAFGPGEGEAGRGVAHGREGCAGQALAALGHHRR